MKLLFVIQTYNAENILQASIKCLCDFVKKNFRFDDFRFEVVIFDQKSTDHTLEIAQELAKAESGIKIFVQEDKKTFSNVLIGIQK